jgi:hypothetical protein
LHNISYTLDDWLVISRHRREKNRLEKKEKRKKIYETAKLINVSLGPFWDFVAFKIVLAGRSHSPEVI